MVENNNKINQGGAEVLLLGERVGEQRKKEGTDYGLF